MPKSNTGILEDLSGSREINAIWTFGTEFPTIFNKSCTFITFKSAVKHRQLSYGYPRGQTVQLAEATTQDTYFMQRTINSNDVVVVVSFIEKLGRTFNRPRNIFRTFRTCKLGLTKPKIYFNDLPHINGHSSSTLLLMHRDTKLTIAFEYWRWKDK